MRKLITILLLLAAFGVYASTQWTLNRNDATNGTPIVETFTVDTLRHEKVGPGTMYTLVYLHGDGLSTHMRAHFLTFDMKNHDDVQFRMELGNDSLLTVETPSSIAIRKNAPGNYYYASCNADFYITWDPYIGNPHRCCYMDGQIAMFDDDEATNYGHFFIDYDKNMWCDFPKQSWTMTRSSGSQVSLSHINHDLNDNQLVLYNELGGHWTKTSNATEIRVRLADGERWAINRPFKMVVVGEPVVGGNMQVRPGEAVLSAKGSRVDDVLSLTDGEELTMLFETRLANYDIKPNLKEASGGDVIILDRGVTAYTAGRFINARDAYNPRTMFGYNEDRSKMVWGLVDGRSARSSGCTYTQGADIMRYAGCYDAVNVDGGGSSTMFMQQLGIVNDPSDGHERAVSNSLHAVLNQPEDNTIAEIRFVDWSMKFPKYGIYTPKFYGYNQYGLLIDTDVQGVTLSCPESLGTIINDGTTFYGIGSGTQALTASYNGLTATIPVTVELSDNISLRLGKVLLDNNRSYEVEVNAMMGETSMPISPMAVAWTSDDNEIASVGATSGVISGLKDGTTTITGTVGNFVGELEVTVEIPTANVMPVLRQFPTDGWTLKQNGGTGLAISKLDNGFRLNYTGNGSARGAYISVERPVTVWSIPDKLRVRVNPGNATIKKVSSSAKNALGEMVGVWVATNETLPTNVETTVEFDLDDWCDPNDIGIYPITLNTLRFDMGASTKGAQFEIQVPGWEAVYNHVQGGAASVKASAATIYPNPVARGGQFTVAAEGAARVEVYTMSGCKVMERSIDGVAAMSTEGMERGVYLVRIADAAGAKTAKLIVR